MGGTCIFLAGSEVGLGTREPESDVAKVLDRLVDVIIARVFSHSSLEKLSKKFDTPIYWYSYKKLKKNIIHFKYNFRSFSPIICFAVKANSNPPPRA